MENTIGQGQSNEVDIATGTVVNSGTIGATHNGVNFQQSGTVTNHGDISGTNSGVSSAGSLSVFNTGTINGTDLAAVYSSYDSVSTSANNVFSLNNIGTLSSANGDGFDAFASNAPSTGTAELSNVITVENSGSINTPAGTGLNFDDENAGGGAALNSIFIGNFGSVSATYAIDVDDLFNFNNAGTATNLITLNNHGTLTSSSEIYISSENEDSAQAASSIYVLMNSGTITSTGGDGLVIEPENDGAGGQATNTVNINNSGMIHSLDDAINLDAFNEYGAGSALLSIYLNNSGSIISTNRYGIDLDDEDYNYQNAGNTTANVTILNSGTITAGEGGIYIEPYNYEDTGSGVTNIYVLNSGTINAGDDEGFEDDEGGNYYEGGNGTTNETLINTGSITGTGNAVESFIYNGDNGGFGVTHEQFSNSGSITATTGSAAYFYLDNYDNGGNGSNSLDAVNKAGGTLTAPADGIFITTLNDTNGGTENSNSISFINAGTINVGQEGVSIEAENSHNTGDASNRIAMVNSGTVLANIVGIEAQVEDSATAGNSDGSISLLNSGSVRSDGGVAVRLENNDTGTVGGSGGSISVVNTSTGVISGALEGLKISNAVFSPTYTGSVTNSGFISGPNGGIEMDTDNGTVLSKGGEIIGLGSAIVLDGTNSSVTFLGRTTVDGVIDGSGNAENVLNFQLAGATLSQIAAAKEAIVAAGGGLGSITIAGKTYEFNGFPTVNFQAMSFKHSVDAGLHQLGAKIDQNPLPGAYDLVYSQGFSNPNATLNSLSGRQFLDSFRQIGLSNATATSELADNRAFQLRAGSTGLDFSGLNVNPASMIASLGDTQNFLGRLGGASVFGGTDMSDSKDEKNVVSHTDGPCWGAWASGTVTFADESGTTDDPGYNGTSGSPTVGVDYKVCPELVVGALFNYTRGNVDFDDGSNLDTDTELGAVYANWTHNHWYVDGLAGYGNTSYDQSRRALDGSNAYGSPDGDEVLATINGGYDFKVGGLLVSPEAGVQYTHLAKDGFSETGAGAFNLNVGDENVDSLRTKIGFHASHLFNWAGLKLNPEVNAAWYHECFNETTGVSNSLPGAPALGSFIVNTNAEGRDFALVGAGIVATPSEWHQSVSFFVNYDAQVGQNNFIAHTVDGGVRVNF